MMTFDDKGQHEVSNDKMLTSFGNIIANKMKTCFDNTLMP